MPREFISKQESHRAKVNEFFAALQKNHRKVNFNDEELWQICNAIIKKVDFKHQVMLRLKAYLSRNKVNVNLWAESSCDDIRLE